MHLPFDNPLSSSKYRKTGCRAEKDGALESSLIRLIFGVFRGLKGFDIKQKALTILVRVNVDRLKKCLWKNCGDVELGYC